MRVVEDHFSMECDLAYCCSSKRAQLVFSAPGGVHLISQGILFMNVQSILYVQ